MHTSHYIPEIITRKVLDSWCLVLSSTARPRLVRASTCTSAATVPGFTAASNGKALLLQPALIVSDA